jgi:histidine triad (HIT) family protein
VEKGEAGMATDCIFCKIVRGEIESSVLYQDEHVTAFRDIQAQAKSHILVIPNEHYDSLDAASGANLELLGRLLKVCTLVARDEGIDQSGYRVLTNVGEDGGQTVGHLHFHVLGGNKLNARLG